MGDDWSLSEVEIIVADYLLMLGEELQGRAYSKAEHNRERDAFVDAAMASAGLPILHFPAQQAYLPAEVRDKIAAALKKR